MKIIHTNKAPAAIGPYSQAIKTNDYVFISGQLGIDPTTGNLITNEVESQTKQALKNLEAILLEANCSINQIVKCTIFVKDMKAFNVINTCYQTFFGNHKPARSTIEVAALPKDGLVEIEAIVYCGK